MSLYIVTLAEMKADLNITDTQDDAVLTRWLLGLQGRFEERCNRCLLRGEDIEEILDGGETYLFLSRFPVESVASVHVSAEQIWTDATKLLPTESILHKSRGRLIRPGSALWPEGEQNVRVVYTGGYVACDGVVAAGQTAMPDALRGLFFMQAGFEWRNRLELGKSGVSVQGQSMQIAEAKLLPEVKSGLALYGRFV